MKKASVMNLLQLITPNVKKFTVEDCQKILTDIAHKQQVKHTFAVMEPSTSFHTLVKLVDGEDVTNEKIRTLDL